MPFQQGEEAPDVLSSTGALPPEFWILPYHITVLTCVLKAAGVRPTLKRNRALRQEVAKELEKCYEENKMIEGISARSVVHMFCISIHDHLKHVLTNQWASAVELAIAVHVRNFLLCHAEKHCD